jgi:acyl dehydratase
MSGKFYEDFEIGQQFKHAKQHIISEKENLAFCAMTENTQPLHVDPEFGRKSAFGRRIVNGILTFGIVVGLSVEELTEGTIIANLGYENIRHPAPVFHGDTISAETEVLEMRVSASNADRGIVRLRQMGRNQKDELVVELERSVLVKKRVEGGA